MGRKARKVQNKKVQKKNSRIGWIVVVVVAVVLAFLFSGVSPFGRSEGKTRSFYVKGGETRPTLEPSLFTGMTRAAYAAAREYPQVLDQVYCYCNCDQPPFNHVSLLSCFVDNHAAGWVLCQEEALRASQLSREGKSISEIKTAIDREFGR